MMRPRLFVAIVTIVPLAANASVSRHGYAQGVGADSGNINVAELARELRETRRELDLLKQRDVERQQWEASMMRRLPPALAVAGKEEEAALSLVEVGSLPFNAALEFTLD